MNSFPSGPRRSKLPVVLFLLAIVIAAVGGVAYYLWPRFESEPPQIALSPNVDTMGLTPVEIVVTDKGTGIKTVTATLSQGGVNYKLAAEQFAQPAAEKKIAIALAKVAGLKDGPAVIRVAARDASLWRGSETVLEKKFSIDTTPPTLELVADDRYVNFGGVGTIVYKASSDTQASGVKVGDHFFPGFPGQMKGHPDYFVALFAHPYDVAPETKATLVATDKAGNTREMRLAYELKNVKYKKSTIALSDGFLQNKVAPLLTDVAKRQGSPKETFIAVNKQLRKENDSRIAELTKKASPSMLWKGAFSQLSNSKVEANFADQRTYTYNGEAIDTRVPPRLRPLSHEELSGRSRQWRHGGLRRRPRHLRQRGDPRPWPRTLHAVRPSEFDRRQGGRFRHQAPGPGQDG